MAGATLAAPFPIVPLQADTDLPIELSLLQHRFRTTFTPFLRGGKPLRETTGRHSVRAFQKSNAPNH
jgi:hypothetical protein